MGRLIQDFAGAGAVPLTLIGIRTGLWAVLAGAGPLTPPPGRGAGPRPWPLRLVPDVGADPILDDRARAAYRARLAELEAELDVAEAAADLQRAERARAERDALVDERARARVRDALGRIEQAHPDLGRHLRETIATGTSCAYAPAAPVDWEL